MRSTFTRLLSLGLMLAPVTACGGRASADHDDLSRAEGGAASRCTSHAGDLVIESYDDVLAAAHVGTVEGDVIIGGDEYLEIDAEALPCLEAVSGSIRIGTGHPAQQLGPIVFERLEVVAGGVAVAFVQAEPPEETAVGFPNLTRVGTPATPGGLQIGEADVMGGIDFPVLEDVHGDFLTAWLFVRTLAAPSLRRVTGSVELGPAADLERLDLGSLDEVGGDFTARILPHIGHSRMVALGGSARGHTSIQQVGCSRTDGDASPDCSKP